MVAEVNPNHMRMHLPWSPILGVSVNLNRMHVH